MSPPCSGTTSFCGIGYLLFIHGAHPKMAPCFSAADAAHLGASKTKAHRDIVASARRVMHPSHHVFGQVRERIRLTAGCPSFRDFIAGVIGVSAKEQVCRIYAHWIVAAVQDV